MKKANRLKIAIQKSGRLNEASIQFLISLGLRFLPNGNSLVQECQNFDLDIIFLRDDDIPEYVGRGVADFGIVGQNVLLEKQVTADVVQKLDFGKCRLVIAVPKKSLVKKPGDLEGERIATTYPGILGTYLKEKGIDAAIIPIAGSVEITPELNLADAICDIVQTGATLKAHNLKSVFTILKSQAVLIESPIVKQAKSMFINKLQSN